MFKDSIIQVIIFKEKNYERTFIATAEDIKKAFLVVFKERNANGLYELRDERDERIYNMACDDTFEKQATAAYQFMNNRFDYEYESYEIINPETV